MMAGRGGGGGRTRTPNLLTKELLNDLSMVKPNLMAKGSKLPDPSDQFWVTATIGFKC